MAASRPGRLAIFVTPITPSDERAAAMIHQKHDSAVECESTAPRQHGNPPTRCPVTGRPCEGDLAYLCDDYGCARKAGLSPHSAENLWRIPNPSSG